jgi:predicted nucleic acid-binding protein
VRAVLADTGPLYALVDPDDEHHRRAQGELERLAKRNYEVVVAFPVMLEAYKLISRNVGIAVGHGWLAEVESRTVLYNPEPEDYREASLRVRRYADQPITLEDALLAILSERLKLPVWTFDHHFDILNVNVWRGS